MPAAYGSAPNPYAAYAAQGQPQQSPDFFQNVLGNAQAKMGANPSAANGSTQSLDGINQQIAQLRTQQQLNALKAQVAQGVGSSVSNAAAGIASNPQTIAAYGSGAYTGGGNLVDRIAAAIRTHESGGNYNALNGSEPANVAARGAYQFIPSTFAGVNKQFGGDGSWSQANQDKVAKAYISSILSANGNNPDAVAATWYVGHVPGSEGEWNSVPYPSAGNTITVRAYAQFIDNYLRQHQ